MPSTWTTNHSPQVIFLVVSRNKRQAFAEKVLIYRSHSETHLLFIQDKFSHDTTENAVLKASKVAAALKNLVKMRGILFDIPEGEEPKNQISQLRVKEKNVTLLFLVLKEVEPTAAKWNTLLCEGRDGESRGHS